MLLLNSVPDYVEAIRLKLAASTRRGYASLLRTYLRSLAPDPTEKDLTEDSIRSYMHSLEKKKRRPATIGSHLAAVRKFCGWLVATEVIAVNPAAGIKPPRLDDPVREVPTDEEIWKLLAAVDSIPDDYRRLLADAVVKALVYTGLRRLELLALDVTDFDAEGVVHVRHGKGNRPRRVKPDEDGIAALRAYIAVRPQCESERLFLLRRDVPLGDRGLRTMLRDLQKMSGQKNSRSLLPHGFRHAYASRLSEGGMHLHGIMTILGHSKLDTTQKYLHTNDQVLEVAARLSKLRRAPISPPPAPDPGRAELSALAPAKVEQPARPVLTVWTADA